MNTPTKKPTRSLAPLAQGQERVTLARAHTDAGTLHEAGAQIVVSAATAQWLRDQGTAQATTPETTED